MTQRFRSRTVLVTGASSGIGAAARLFAAEGARVVLAARSEDALNRVAAEIGGPERALAVPCDVTDVAALTSLVDVAERRFGSIHILINNAGYNARGAVETVPDIVFSQPMSTAEEVARVIADCAARGTRERAMPPLSGYLTTLGYLLPAASRALRPWLERQGRRRKKRYARP